MKKILLLLAIIVALALSANAQTLYSFYGSEKAGDYHDRSLSETQGILKSLNTQTKSNVTQESVYDLVAAETWQFVAGHGWANLFKKPFDRSDAEWIIDNCELMNLEGEIMVYGINKTTNSFVLFKRKAMPGEKMLVLRMSKFNNGSRTLPDNVFAPEFSTFCLNKIKELGLGQPNSKASPAPPDNALAIAPQQNLGTQQPCCGNTYNYYYGDGQQEPAQQPQYWVPAQQAPVYVTSAPAPATPPIIVQQDNRPNGVEIATLAVASADLLVDVIDAFGNRRQQSYGYGYCGNGGYANSSGGNNVYIYNQNTNTNTNHNSQYQSTVGHFPGTTTGGGPVNPGNGGNVWGPVNPTNGRTGFSGGSIAGTTSIGPGGQVIKW